MTVTIPTKSEPSRRLRGGHLGCRFVSPPANDSFRPVWSEDGRDLPVPVEVQRVDLARRLLRLTGDLAPRAEQVVPLQRRDRALHLVVRGLRPVVLVYVAAILG